MAITPHYPQTNQEVYANHNFCVWGLIAQNENIQDVIVELYRDSDGMLHSQSIMNPPILTPQDKWAKYSPALPKPQEVTVNGETYRPVLLKIIYKVGMMGNNITHELPFRWTELAFVVPQT